MRLVCRSVVGLGSCFERVRVQYGVGRWLVVAVGNSVLPFSDNVPAIKLGCRSLSLGHAAGLVGNETESTLSMRRGCKCAKRVRRR